MRPRDSARTIRHGRLDGEHDGMFEDYGRTVRAGARSSRPDPSRVHRQIGSSDERNLEYRVDRCDLEPGHRV